MIEALSPIVILGVVAAYFLVLMVISYYTGKDSGNANFFLAGRQSPWYLSSLWDDWDFPFGGYFYIGSGLGAEQPV